MSSVYEIRGAWFCGPTLKVWFLTLFISFPFLEKLERSQPSPEKTEETLLLAGKLQFTPCYIKSKF